MAVFFLKIIRKTERQHNFLPDYQVKSSYINEEPANAREFQGQVLRLVAKMKTIVMVA